MYPESLPAENLEILFVTDLPLLERDEHFQRLLLANAADCRQRLVESVDLYPIPKMSCRLAQHVHRNSRRLFAFFLVPANGPSQAVIFEAQDRERATQLLQILAKQHRRLIPSISRIPSIVEDIMQLDGEWISLADGAVGIEVAEIN